MTIAVVVIFGGGVSGEGEETFTETRSADAAEVAGEIDGVSFTPHRRERENGVSERGDVLFAESLF